MDGGHEVRRGETWRICQRGDESLLEGGEMDGAG